MSALPTKADILFANNPTNTTGSSWLGAMHDYLTGLFGADGTKATARATLIPVGTSGQVLTSNGTDWAAATPSGGSGVTADSSNPYNTYAGYAALEDKTTCANSTAFGFGALRDLTSADNNTAFGADAAKSVTTGAGNNAFGSAALYSTTTGTYNAAFGVNALRTNTTGADNNAFGRAVLYSNTDGTQNNGYGSYALNSVTTGDGNTAIGHASLFNLTTYDNCTGLGAGSAVTGSNQVQLGNNAATTYAYGAVQDRSDARDKANIRDTVLGLSFITSLRPVDFNWNYRSDYTERTKSGETITHPEGSKIRSRFHHGLIAQEVKSTLDSLGVDFGGYQDHTINGGQDVLSIGYTELIGPLIKAIQELNEKVERLSKTP